VDRIQALGSDSRARWLLLAVALVLLVGVALFASSLGGKGEAERAKDVLEQGLDLHAHGDLEGAKEAYLRVIQLDPQNKYAYYNLGLISQTRGDAVAAESSYRTTITIDPDFVPALFNLAILRSDAGSNQEAIDLYRHVIELNPTYAAAHLNLGFLLIDEGDETQGQAELDEAVRLDPSLEDRIAPTSSNEPSGASP
jgi:tetratricopeptide (TPR) repeat protein